MESWSLFIDIEGFSPMYRKSEYLAVMLLSKLMGYIYKIGTEIYFDDYDRLFAYQIGDGFIISPNLEQNPKRAIAIAIALMHSILLDGGVARAAISTGDMGDILECYPTEVKDSYYNGSVTLGSGIMTINPVMGDALINAYKLESINVKGPLLLLDKSLVPYIEDNTDFVLHINDTNYCSINWIYTNTGQTEKILRGIGMEIKSPKFLSDKLCNYIKRNTLPDEWEKNAKSLIGMQDNQ